MKAISRALLSVVVGSMLSGVAGAQEVDISMAEAAELQSVVEQAEVAVGGAVADLNSGDESVFGALNLIIGTTPKLRRMALEAERIRVLLGQFPLNIIEIQFSLSSACLEGVDARFDTVGALDELQFEFGLSAIRARQKLNQAKGLVERAFQLAKCPVI